jgi:hypothetical protein
LFSAVVAIGTILRCAACLAHTNQIRDAARRDTSAPMSFRRLPRSLCSTDTVRFFKFSSEHSQSWKYSQQTTQLKFHKKNHVLSVGTKLHIFYVLFNIAADTKTNLV